MGEELTREEVHAAVDRMVADLLTEAKVLAPPVDAVALAVRHLGLALKEEDRGRRGRPGATPRPEPTAEHRQWMAAQQIGLHLKPGLLRRLGLDPEQKRPMMGESLATLVASHLLVPTGWLVDEARSRGFELPALKQSFLTASHEVLSWRLLDLPEPCIITIVDNDRVSRRRSNAWRINRLLEPPERECQRYVNQHGRPRVVRQNGWTVQGWPIHQPGWKREVLRSVVEVDG